MAPAKFPSFRENLERNLPQYPSFRVPGLSRSAFLRVAGVPGGKTRPEDVFKTPGGAVGEGEVFDLLPSAGEYKPQPPPEAPPAGVPQDWWDDYQALLVKMGVASPEMVDSRFLLRLTEGERALFQELAERISVAVQQYWRGQFVSGKLQAPEGSPLARIIEREREGAFGEIPPGAKEYGFLDEEYGQPESGLPPQAYTEPPPAEELPENPPTAQRSVNDLLYELQTWYNEAWFFAANSADPAAAIEEIEQEYRRRLAILMDMQAAGG